MSTYYVYQLRLESSQFPFYVGKGKEKRAWKHLMPCHLLEQSHKNNTILKAIREGEPVVVEIIRQNLTEIEALDLEIQEIEKHGLSRNGGCLTNCVAGGLGMRAWKMPQETRDKISAANKGKKRTLETREKMSVAFKGRKLSPEHVASIVKANTGRKASEETKAKMSVARIGKQRPEHGPKVSAALTGVKHPPDRVKTMTFGNWDNNPAWKMSDVIYKQWKTLGKPGLIRLQKSFQNTNIGSMHAKFSKGWIPTEDPTWIEYAKIRGQAFETSAIRE